MIADDPVDLAVEYRLPQGLHVLARANRRIDLRVHGAFAVGIEQEMPDGNFPAEADMGEDHLHRPSRVHCLART